METQKQSFFERYSVTIKLITIGILILLFLIPVGMIRSLIREREQTLKEANTEVNNSWGNRQRITGPVLTIPFTKHYYADDKDKPITKRLHFLPTLLKIDGKIDPKLLHRGIYNVAVYKSKLILEGTFSKPDITDLGIDKKDIHWDQAYISMGITDMRGIKDVVNYRTKNKSYTFESGVPDEDIFSSGIHIKLEEKQPGPAKPIDFRIELNLNGSEEISFIPIGKETYVDLESSWKDPSFSGSFLPTDRTVTNEGFNANWKVFHLNRNYPQKWINNSYDVNESEFGVELILPVDRYTKTERSVKYAALFIFLTFITFFILEILSKNRVHPVQYTLVGMGLVIFYILLLSLSEQIAFTSAYLIASFAVISLITFYCSFVFQKKLHVILTSAVLIGLYAYIFVLLQLQDLALLAGSIGLFAIIGILMITTRKINWYQTRFKSSQSEE